MSLEKEKRARLFELMERAHAKARAERLYFKEVVIPARIKEIEREFTGNRVQV